MMLMLLGRGLERNVFQLFLFSYISVLMDAQISQLIVDYFGGENNLYHKVRVPSYLLVLLEV